MSADLPEGPHPRVDRRRDRRIVDAAIQLGGLDLALLKDHEGVKAQSQKIFERAQRVRSS